MMWSQGERGKIIFLIKTCLGLVLLALVSYQMQWHDFILNFGQLSVPLLLLMFIGTAADRFIMGFKWNLLLKNCDVFIPFKKIVSTYFISSFLGAFTPGALGGDAYRVMTLSPEGKRAQVLSTVVLERVMGLLALIFYVIAALPFSFSLFGADASMVAVISITVAVLILLIIFLPLYQPLRSSIDLFCQNRNSIVIKKIHLFFNAYTTQNRSGKILVIFFIMTLLETGYFFFLNYLAVRVGGLDTSIAFIFMVMPVVHFVLRIPITVQGIGLQEGLFAYAISLAGYSLTQGVVISLVWRLVVLVAVYLPGGLLMLFRPAMVPDNSKFHR